MTAVHLPLKVKESLKKEAIENNRSLSAQIAFILETREQSK